jgi:membrane protease YdiL (CAAX protease family)
MRPLLLEIGVVLAVAVIPSMLYSGLYYFQPSTQGPPQHAGMILFQECVKFIQCVLPLMFVLWLSKRGFGHFGIKPVKWPSDILLAIAIFFWVHLTWIAIWYFLYFAAPDFVTSLADASNARLDQSFADMRTPAQFAMLVPACLLIGFSEELIFRGYLQTRLRDLTGSAPHALVITSLLFGMGHIYQGTLGIFSATLLGFIFGFSFLRIRRLWPVALGHALVDIVAFTWN